MSSLEVENTVKILPCGPSLNERVVTIETLLQSIQAGPLYIFKKADTLEETVAKLLGRIDILERHVVNLQMEVSDLQGK
ncbi:MAG TPA: hypothetical protein VJ327_03340 [Patescibacteria group bacterium]|nr:hypothetical protein [Patescibacteria group bacterium]